MLQSQRAVSRVANSLSRSHGAASLLTKTQARDLHVSTPVESLRIRDSSRQGVSGVVATVFGCTGFVGRYVVSKFGRGGSQVVIPFRGDGLHARHLKVAGDLGQIVPFQLDPRDPESFRRAVAQSNVVVNLIGADWQTNNFKFDDVHVNIAKTIAEVSAQSGVEKLIHFSALGASHDSPSEFLASKARGEDAVREAFPDATVVRPSKIFGHEDRFLNRIASIMNIIPSFPVFNSGDQRLQPVHVNDVASAVHKIIEQPHAGQTFELAGPSIYSFDELISYIAELIHTDKSTVDVPLSILKLYGAAAELVPQKFRVYSKDEAIQQSLDFVSKARPGVETFKTLGITPNKLEHFGKQLMVVHRGSRGQAFGFVKETDA